MINTSRWTVVFWLLNVAWVITGVSSAVYRAILILHLTDAVLPPLWTGTKTLQTDKSCDSEVPWSYLEGEKMNTGRTAHYQTKSQQNFPCKSMTSMWEEMEEEDVFWTLWHDVKSRKQCMLLTVSVPKRNSSLLKRN